MNLKFSGSFVYYIPNEYANEFNRAFDPMTHSGRDQLRCDIDYAGHEPTANGKAMLFKVHCNEQRDRDFFALSRRLPKGDNGAAMLYDARTPQIQRHVSRIQGFREHFSFLINRVFAPQLDQFFAPPPPPQPPKHSEEE